MEEAQVRARQIGDFTEMLKKSKKGAPAFKEFEPAKMQQAQGQTQDTGTMSTPPPPPNTPMTQIYFYHPDHLGTSTLIF